jgi:cytochrome d ubiquinol oxidase subunit II
VALCGFLAAIYIVGETEDIDDIKRYIRKAKDHEHCSRICGGLVFIASQIEHVRLSKWIFGNAVSLVAVIAATISLALLWFIISQKKNRQWIRMLAAFQVCMILISVGFNAFPRFVIFKDGSSMSLLSDHANS